MMIRARVLAIAVVVCTALCLCAANSASAASIYDDAIAYWSFDEGTVSATTVSDQSLTDPIDLAINGAMTATEGQVGNALFSDGGNFLSTGADIDALDLARDEDFTFVGWYKFTADGTVLASKMESSGNYRGWWVYMSVDQRLDFLLRSTNTASDRLWIRAPENDISLNEWVHIAATFSYDPSDELRGASLYVNGEAVEAELYNDGISTNPPGDTDNASSFNVFGRNGVSYGFKGTMDEIAVWKRALSATEIQDVYELASVPEPSTLALLLAALMFGLIWPSRKR